MILSDRGVDKTYAPIPALLATAGVHHHLIRQGKRMRCGIVVESAEPREIHHFCCLTGYGAGAVNPYPPNLPPSYPLDGFTPQEQGAFLAQAAALVRQLDPDAVIVLPGTAGISDYHLDTWFPGVIQGGGTDWFDVVMAEQ